MHFKSKVVLRLKELHVFLLKCRKTRYVSEKELQNFIIDDGNRKSTRHFLIKDNIYYSISMTILMF